jgi:hypothetical protein
MGEAAVVIISTLIFTAFMIVIFRGSVKILREHFWLGVIMFLLLTPLFFIFAFIEGIKPD